MCGRYASTRSREDLLETFKIEESLADEEKAPDYNVAPTKTSPTVLARPPRDAGEDAEPVRQLRNLKWGPLPNLATEKGAPVPAKFKRGGPRSTAQWCSGEPDHQWIQRGACRVTDYPSRRLVSPARGDVCEEDIGRSVVRLWACQAEDGGEAGPESCQALVFPEPVLSGRRRGTEVGRPGDMDLLPGRATVPGG